VACSMGGRSILPRGCARRQHTAVALTGSAFPVRHRTSLRKAERCVGGVQLGKRS
jgi:hypothetical protein